jgi:hypothetical protein
MLLRARIEHCSIVVCAAVLALAVTVSRASALIPNVRLTLDPASSARPRVALDPSGNAIVVWQDGRFGNDEILWQKFDPLGNALTSVIRVTNTAAASRWPDVSCDPSGVSHVAWQEGENVNGVGAVFFCRLNSAGTKILNDVQIPTSNVGHPRVEALANGSTDLVYYRSSGVIDFYTLYARYSAAGGPVCSKQLGGSITATVINPSIATDASGTAFLLWFEIPTSNYTLRATSVASCGTPSTTTVGTASSTTYTTSAMGGSSVLRMFDTGGNIQNVLVGGGTCQISQGSGQASTPSVGGDANDGYVVWRDNRDGGNGEIYLARFGGCTNRSGDVRLTTDPAVSVEPDIAVDPSGSGNWIAVWRDARDGNNEIYLTSRVLIDGPTPASPAGLTVSRTVGACPPTASLQWTDASSNETRFEVEMETDGDAVWVAAATLPVGATSWTSGALVYGHTYAFRVRACNGTYCSDWAGPQSLTIDMDLRLFQGTVSATVIGAPTDGALLQRLRRARVSLFRAGQPIASTIADDAGIYSLLTTVQCDDQLGIVLDDFRVTVEDLAGADGQDCHLAGKASWSEPLPAIGHDDLVWPLTNDISGEAPNLWYWVQRTLDEYWSDVLGVDYATVPNLSGSVNRAKTSAFYWPCEIPYPPNGGPSGYVKFAARFGRYRSGIEHELAHHLIRMKAERSFYRFSEADWKNDPQMGGLDEGLADYFAAAFDDDPAIYPYVSKGVFYPWSLRNLSKLTRLHTCDGTFHFSGDAHVEGSALGGALWDWRKRLIDDHSVPAGDVDRAVFEAVRSFRDQMPYDPTLTGFRSALGATAFGSQHSDDLDWAFDRHNIKLAMDNDLTCPIRPVLQQIQQFVAADGRHTNLAWTRVPNAHHYRISVRQFTLGSGLDLGEIVADSLVDTTYAHIESDTTALDAFLVSAIDDSGDVMTASDETPAITAVSLPATNRPSSMLEVFPNPARAGTVIRWGRGGSGLGRVRVRVFDVLGRLVRDLGVLPAVGEVHWDGRDDGGHAAPSGIYVVVLEVARTAMRQRVVIVR